MALLHPRQHHSRKALALLFLLAATPSWSSAPIDTIKVVATYPHSTSSYTEGFFYLDGFFYESTGLNGHSEILVTDPATGKVLQHRDLSPQYFGEGIIDWGPNLLQWTWQSHIGFIYDRFTLRPIGQFTYSGEGWGMTRTARQIITSNGTANLAFRNPTTFAILRTITVHDGAQAINQLNELESINGVIYANVWHTDRIARISPTNGAVLSWIDLSGLLPDNQRINSESVLNGIAWDAKHKRLFVTGKQWPTIFEIKILPHAHH